MAKNGREPFRSWIPSSKEVAALDGAVALPCQGIIPIHKICNHCLIGSNMAGRRGLLNLGQTCYLNVVLQSFVHNPLLRNYFLSDKHNSLLCNHKPTGCTSCEMDKLFTEVITHSITLVESNNSSRYTQIAPSHTAQHLFWPQLGRLPLIYQAIANKTRTSSLSRLSIRFTQLHVGRLTSPATVSYTPHLRANCKVTSSASAVGTSQRLWTRCWTSVWSCRS